MKNASIEASTAKTIDDFGAQWTTYTENSGYYASTEMFEDIAAGTISMSEIRGCKAADIGSGTGRIVAMLLGAGAAHVTAIEPSAAMYVLKENLHKDHDKIAFMQERGEAVGKLNNLDLVTSIGVLHHIPEPMPVVAEAYKALRPGGKILVWLYAKEGNEAYLSFALPLRQITKRLPDFLLKIICHTLNIFLDAYILLCRILPLPMHRYMKDMLGKLSREQRYLTIYDQLNPEYAKYYTEKEAYDLIAQGGFKTIKVAKRHGYSWTVCGEK